MMLTLQDREYVRRLLYIQGPLSERWRAMDEKALASSPPDELEKDAAYTLKDSSRCHFRRKVLRR